MTLIAAGIILIGLVATIALPAGPREDEPASADARPAPARASQAG